MVLQSVASETRYCSTIVRSGRRFNFFNLQTIDRYCDKIGKWDCRFQGNSNFTGPSVNGEWRKGNLEVQKKESKRDVPFGGVMEKMH